MVSSQARTPEAVARTPVDAFIASYRAAKAHD